ncbi:MAG: hypothetical protein ACFE94_19610 [Candidatus Hodarchaeota archaeon]
MKKDYESVHDCLSWNCCDDHLKSCIERSKYVNQIRTCLKKRKLTYKKKKDLYTKY